MSIRPVKHISGTTPHIEGAGVNLQRCSGLVTLRLQIHSS
jgi:hypothetical protein